MALNFSVQAIFSDQVKNFPYLIRTSPKLPVREPSMYSSVLASCEDKKENWLQIQVQRPHFLRNHITCEHNQIWLEMFSHVN